MKAGRVERDERTRSYIGPTRIVAVEGDVKDAGRLLEPGSGQATIWSSPGAFLPPGASLILDYGEELHGGVQIIAGCAKNARSLKVRLRFGESVSETLGKPNNDHAMHDTVVELAAMGATEYGNTGFRFLRIDNAESDATLEIREARAVSLMRDLEWRGAFECDDERLNEIWRVGARTVHLCLQDYLWDGAKRDRLVWMGDMHPEIVAAGLVFGKIPVVERSLDLVRDETPIPKFMNGIVSYSLCWLLAQESWFQLHGDLDYLASQRTYLKELLPLFFEIAAKRSKEELALTGIIDWAHLNDAEALKGAFPALMTLGMEAAARLCDALREKELAGSCRACAKSLREAGFPVGRAKSANAFQVLAGMLDAKETNAKALSVDPLKNLSPFPAYYVLQARAKAGELDACLDLVRRYWGGMLDLGATSFWEHFDIDWLENGGRVDEVPTPGKIDVHASYGAGCFKGHRNSFCHGWASAPTPWLLEHVLGVKILEAGARRVAIEPHLGHLRWAKGRAPTPRGPLEVEARRMPDGSVESEISAPPGTEIQRA